MRRLTHLSPNSGSAFPVAVDECEAAYLKMTKVTPWGRREAENNKFKERWRLSLKTNPTFQVEIFKGLLHLLTEF